MDCRTTLKSDETVGPEPLLLRSGQLAFVGPLPIFALYVFTGDGRPATAGEDIGACDAHRLPGYQQLRVLPAIEALFHGSGRTISTKIVSKSAEVTPIQYWYRGLFSWYLQKVEAGSPVGDQQ